MGFSDFWLQFNNGKKEQLNDVGHGVRKEQLDPKFAPLFEFFDRNGDGVLEANELQSIFDNVKSLSGDNVLDSAENATAKSIFADQVHLKDADLQGFVKSVSDASKDIVFSEEKVTPDGGKEIKTEYKDGTISTIAYYPNGDFKYEKLVKRYIETKYVLESPEGKKTNLTKEEYDKAIKDVKYMEGKFNVSENFSVDNTKTTETTYNKELEDTLIKPHSNVPNSARGIASTNISEGSKISKITNEIEEPIEQVFSPRALAESLDVNLNTEDGKKILERLSHFDRDWLKILRDGTEVKELLTSNDLTPTFDNISNVLEIVYGITLRNEEEYNASEGNRNLIIKQIQTVAIMSELYAAVAQYYDEATDSLGLFGMGAEGLQYITNKLLGGFESLSGINGQNKYQWADSCREFIEKINTFKVLNPAEFKKEFNGLTGKDNFNISALQKMLDLAENNKAQDKDGNYTEEYKNAVKEFSNFDITNINAKAWYHPENLLNGLGEALVMIITLGWGAETKAGQMLASSAYATFTRAGVAIASKQVNNKLIQGALRFAGKTVKLIGPALNEGTKMYTYSAVVGTTTNAINRAAKYDSEENPLLKFLQTEAMVLDGAKGSFAFGAFAGVFGSTVTQRVMQRASKVSKKVGAALSDKLTKGAVNANEVYATILEKSAPTFIGEAAAFATDILGFTAFESAIAIYHAKNDKVKYPNGISVDDFAKILMEEFGDQSLNLGQIKGISMLVMFLSGSRSARMQAMKYMRENPMLKGATVEGAGGGKLRINLPDGRKIECKNTTEMIASMHLLARGETALSKKFDRPKANAQKQNEQKANDTNEGVSQGAKSGVNEGVKSEGNDNQKTNRKNTEYENECKHKYIQSVQNSKSPHAVSDLFVEKIVTHDGSEMYIVSELNSSGKVIGRRKYSVVGNEVREIVEVKRRTFEELSPAEQAEARALMNTQKKYSDTMQKCRENSEQADALYQKYINEQNAEPKTKEYCLKINNEFGLKIFFCNDINGTSENIVKIYNTLSDLAKRAEACGEKLNIPSTLEPHTIDNFLTNIGGSADIANNRILFRGFSETDAFELFLHELTHFNDKKSLNNYPENFDKTQAAEELKRAGIKEHYIDYALNSNPAELIAVAMQKSIDASYSPEFTKVLKDFGLPDYMLYTQNKAVGTGGKTQGTKATKPKFGLEENHAEGKVEGTTVKQPEGAVKVEKTNNTNKITYDVQNHIRNLDTNAEKLKRDYSILKNLKDIVTTKVGEKIKNWNVESVTKNKDNIIIKLSNNNETTAIVEISDNNSKITIENGNSRIQFEGNECILEISDGKQILYRETSKCSNQNITRPKSRRTEIYSESGELIEIREIRYGGNESVYNFKTHKYTVECQYDNQRTKKEYEVKIIHPDEIYFSQSCVNKGYTEILASMSENGWQGVPIHAVKMPSGELVSYDNRRLLSARKAGIDAHVVIHDYNEPLTDGQKMRSRIVKVNEETGKSELVAKPQTWGEMVYNRLVSSELVDNETLNIKSKAKEPPQIGSNTSGDPLIVAAYEKSEPIYLRYLRIFL